MRRLIGSYLEVYREMRTKRCQSVLKKQFIPLLKAGYKELTGMLILLILAMQPVWAKQQSGTAIKASEIRTQPYSDAKVLTTLSAGDSVTILKKQGGWLRVKSAKGSGWVRMLSISKGGATKSGKAEGLLGLASGRAGTGKVVATTGIRGLSEEDLKAAQFNAQELQLAESFATTPTEAQKFARQGLLTVQRFDYLPAPTAPTGGQRP
jgi:hypothetical protein